MNKENARFHTIIFTEEQPGNISRFKHHIESTLRKNLGESFHVEYVFGKKEITNNLSACFPFIEKVYGPIDDNITFNFKKDQINSQKFIIVSWKNKKSMLNRIFG